MFDGVEAEVRAWEEAFRRHAATARGEHDLMRVARRHTARRLLAIQAANLTSRVVNLANGTVLLLNGRNAHSAPAVARALFETCAMAVYTDRCITPLLTKRRSPKRTADAHRILYRLGLGTHPSSEISHIRAYPVDSFVRAIARNADELMREPPPPGPDPHGPRIAFHHAERDLSYSKAVTRTYAVLSEFTHPNQVATSLSHEGEMEWVLQPDVSLDLLDAVLQPTWLALVLGRLALERVITAAEEFPMEFPDADPDLRAEDINTTTKILPHDVPRGRP